MSEEKHKAVMDCTQVNEMLTAYLDNEVTPEERQEIEAHLSTCPHCRKELEELRSAQKILRRALKTQAADANPPPQSWSKFELGLEMQRPSFLFLFRRRRWRIIGTIIILAIIITLAILWGVGILPGIRG
jgi:anti-sigma factor (TIGR02949 family)